MDKLSPVAIYIHWPWCKAKCPYCDFNSHAGHIQEDVYVHSLLGELQSWHNGRAINGKVIEPFSPTRNRVESLFFGGGTPSLMQASHLGKVIEICRELGVMDDATEVTVECNPTSFDDARPAQAFFEDLKAVGVNRISVGIQGLKPEWLAFLGRTHRVEEALATLEAAQRVFSNVNADVIYGLPNQDVAAWLQQLKTLAGLGLSHISAYQLTIEPNTHFFRDVRKGVWTPISADLEADFFEATRDSLASYGYENYEISNFAKPGQACKHNTHVWKYGEYLGVGAGAHGRVCDEHGTVLATQVMRQPDGYLRRMNDLGNGLAATITLNSIESVQEAVFSGLRLKMGCDVETLLERFGVAAYKEGISAHETRVLTDAGLLEMADGHLRLTREGWPRLNGILKRILKPLVPSPGLSPSVEPLLSTRDANSHDRTSPDSHEYSTTLSVVIE